MGQAEVRASKVRENIGDDSVAVCSSAELITEGYSEWSQM